MENKVNINTATAEDLKIIKYIGDVISNSIIDNRPYKDIYELSIVPRIGKIRMEQFASQIKV